MTNFELLERVNLACHQLNDHERCLIYTEDPQQTNNSEGHPGITVRLKVDDEFKYLHVRRILSSHIVQLILDNEVEAEIPMDAEQALIATIQRIVRKHIHKTAQSESD